MILLGSLFSKYTHMHANRHVTNYKILIEKLGALFLLLLNVSTKKYLILLKFT
jgi:hypothetical protein